MCAELPYVQIKSKSDTNRYHVYYFKCTILNSYFPQNSLILSSKSLFYHFHLFWLSISLLTGMLLIYIINTFRYLCNIDGEVI